MTTVFAISQSPSSSPADILSRLRRGEFDHELKGLNSATNTNTNTKTHSSTVYSQVEDNCSEDKHNENHQSMLSPHQVPLPLPLLPLLPLLPILPMLPIQQQRQHEQQQAQQTQQQKSQSTNALFRKIERIKQAISVIDNLRYHVLNFVTLLTVTYTNTHSITAHVEETIREVLCQSIMAKTDLHKLWTSESEVEFIQFQILIEPLRDNVRAFLKQVQLFNQALKDRSQLLLYILHPNLPEAAIKQIVECGRAEIYIVGEDNASTRIATQATLKTILTIQERHVEIERINKHIQRVSEVLKNFEEPQTLKNCDKSPTQTTSTNPQPVKSNSKHDYEAIKKVQINLQSLEIEDKSTKKTQEAQKTRFCCFWC